LELLRLKNLGRSRQENIGKHFAFIENAQNDAKLWKIAQGNPSLNK